MKNYWLDRNAYTEPIIKQVIFSTHWTNGKWYISRELKAEVDIYKLHWDEDSFAPSYYLHKDGDWVRSSTKKDGQYSGYYATKEEAEKVLYEKLLVKQEYEN